MQLHFFDGFGTKLDQLVVTIQLCFNLTRSRNQLLSVYVYLCLVDEGKRTIIFMTTQFSMKEEEHFVTQIFQLYNIFYRKVITYGYLCKPTHLRRYFEKDNKLSLTKYPQKHENLIRLSDSRYILFLNLVTFEIYPRRETISYFKLFLIPTLFYAKIVYFGTPLP